MSNDDLDRLLSAPLAEPEDRGFSARVLARVARDSSRAARLEGIGYGVAAAAFVAALALSPLGDVMSAMTPHLAGSQPVMVGAAILILTFFVGREFARR